MSAIGQVELDGDVSAWLEALPPYQEQTLRHMLESATPEEAAITWLEHSGPEHTAPLGALRTGANIFYDKLLAELRELFCGGERYAEERSSLIKEAKAGRAALIALVSAALAPHLGVAAVLIGPPIAIALAIIGRAGEGTACEAISTVIQRRSESALGSSD